MISPVQPSGFVTTKAQTPEKQGASAEFDMVLSYNDRMAGSVPVWKGQALFAENIAARPQVIEESSLFDEIIDIINPLHHIPVVSRIYQSLSGDTIGGLANIVGGALFGGPLGALTSAGMVALQSSDNKSSPPATSVTENTQQQPIIIANQRPGYRSYNN